MPVNIDGLLRYNSEVPEARQYLYQEFPSHFFYNPTLWKWAPRQRDTMLLVDDMCEEEDQEDILAGSICGIRTLQNLQPEVENCDDSIDSDPRVQEQVASGATKRVSQ
ncbi:hypothetical protein BDZ91DRAFT_723683 [Kalaharituber pfeilii]|nr:hypothetical protein BDZ91DRAFT_723683 [Kalaharituber pfeilii]